MKPNLQTYVRSIGGIITIIAMLSPTMEVARADDNPDPTQAPRVGYDLEVSNGMLVVDGKNSEATLANVVEVLRARYQHANIVIAPGLGQLKISDLKLRAGQLIDELEAIRVASGEKFEVQGPRPGVGPVPPMDPNTGLPVSGAMNSGLFVLQAPTTAQSERVVEAFNIEPYLMTLRKGVPASENAEGRDKRERQSIEDLTRIVMETMEMLKGEPQASAQPVFRFHRGASLLVVIGPRESVEVARKIVNALPGMGAPQRAEAGAANAAALEAFKRRYGLAPSDSSGTAAPAPAQK